jgi:hypothetical protein
LPLKTPERARVSGQQLPREPHEVVKGEACDLPDRRGDEKGCQQHEPEHAIGIGSRTRNLKRALRVVPPVQRGRLVALD